MTAKQLFEAGKVRDAQMQLAAHLREHPTDLAQRTFLFELLCFSGDFDRAEKQLGVIAQHSPDAQTGAVLYYAALHAEKTRHQVFANQDFSKDQAAFSPPGMLNGRPFQILNDADRELGPRLEVFAAGAYLWIPFQHIDSVEIRPPQRLRDTLWVPAVVRTRSSFKNPDLGEVLIPAIYPFSWRHPDQSVWLGRATDWMTDDEGNEYPAGQKMLLLDGEEIPFLEIRSLDFVATQAANSAAD
jgi:type VI secretion system protein ImpE